MRQRIKQLKQLAEMVFGRDQSNRWLFLTPGQRHYINKVGDGSASSVVMAPLLWIGRNFPEAPPALWQKLPDSGEEERVTGKGEQGGDHILLELLERPNDFYSGSVLWMATLMDWHLSGDGYWIKIRDAGKRPVQLWWTPSALMKPKGDEQNFITHYEYRPGTDTIDIQPEDVVHFRYGIDPENPRKGKSPLSSLLQEVFTDDEARDFTASLLRNMGVPGIVVSPKGNDTTPSPDDVKATKAYMKEGFSGDRRGEPLVMSGPTDVEQFGFTPRQMELRDIRKIPEERVSAALGVPAIVAGLGAGLDRSTFANYAEAREAAYQDNIIPAQRMLSEDVRFQLLIDFEPNDYRSFRFGFDLSSVRVLQEDRNKLAERFDVGIQGGWIRVAEGRRAMDLEVDDADEIYLRPSTVIEVPVGEAMVAPDALLSPGSPGQPALPPGETPAELQPGEMPMDMPMAGRNGHGSKNKREDVRKGRSRNKRAVVRAARFQAQLHHALILDQLALTAQFSAELEGHFLAFGDNCATEYAQLESATPVRARDGALVKQNLDPESVARSITDKVKETLITALKGAYSGHTLRSFERTMNTINTITGISVGVSDETQKQILETAGKRVGLIDIENQTKNSIFHAIDQGNQMGAGPIDIARSIRTNVPAGRYVNSGPQYRSQLIARTETNWAQNTSSIAAYRESDVVSSVVALDGSDDPECAERNGQVFSFDEAEIEMGNEHPNGTLCFAPVVEEMVVST